MKNTNAYKIIINNINQGDKQFAEFAQGTASILTLEEIEKCGGIENSKIEVLFLVIDPIRFEQLKDLYNSLGILIKAEDITDKIINDDLDDTELKLIRYNQFMNERVNDMIKYNIDKDFVLDKILSHGINSLTDIELAVLKN